MRAYLWASAVFCAVLSAGLPASGALYTVPLDGLRGVYSTAGFWPVPSGVDGQVDHTRTVSFDMGSGFERIDSIRVHATGTTMPVLSPFFLGHDSHGEPGSVSITQEMVFSIDLDRPPSSGYRFFEFDPGGGAFDIETDLILSEGLSQSRLFLTGRGEMELLIRPFLWIDRDDGGNPVLYNSVPGLTGIWDAYLLIDGVAIPEPSSIWLAGAAFAALVVSRARRRAS